MQKITFLFNVPSIYLLSARPNVFATIEASVWTHDGKEYKSCIESMQFKEIDALDLNNAFGLQDILCDVAVKTFLDRQRPNAVQIAENLAA